MIFLDQLERLDDWRVKIPVAEGLDDWIVGKVEDWMIEILRSSFGRFG